MKTFLSILVSVTMLLTHSYSTNVLDLNTIQATQNTSSSENNQNLTLATPSAILMEATTGTIIYEKNSHERLRPASITKIMTLILIFEAIENGNISKTDTVTVSEHAASMGGSQVYLEPGEEQTVEDLLKCISIASANDACVAMAEFIAGSEEAFVDKMNQKAAELQMNDTTFVNCCGLEASGHLTSAYDIALMSMELINQHPDIYHYCSIWMDTIYHTTKRGTKEFGLTNTNKLLRYYSYTTGLKTGYTSQSKYCISATAQKDNVNLIAVVMAEESPKMRNKEVVSLFNYGFSNCSIYTDNNEEALSDISISHGTKKMIPVAYKSPFQAVLTTGMTASDITKNIVIEEPVSAPLSQGDVVGYAVYMLEKKQLGTVDIVCQESVEALSIPIAFRQMLTQFLFSGCSNQI